MLGPKSPTTAWYQCCMVWCVGIVHHPYLTPAYTSYTPYTVHRFLPLFLPPRHVGFVRDGPPQGSCTWYSQWFQGLSCSHESEPAQDPAASTCSLPGWSPCIFTDPPPIHTFRSTPPSFFLTYKLSLPPSLSLRSPAGKIDTWEASYGMQNFPPGPCKPGGRAQKNQTCGWVPASNWVR